MKFHSISWLNHGNFICGTNVPWINFAKDVVFFPEESQKIMEQALDEVKDAGGNAIRWWLHTNGFHSPNFKNGRVSGLHKDTISIMRRVLDMAREKQITVSMCLWSFDMLQTNQGQNVQAMRNLLEDPIHTRAYIDCALIPILEEIGDHPAVLTWEVFNEPEGMVNNVGWTEVKTEMKYIQQTVNLIAGAIHRNNPNAKVSSGTWNMRFMTDIGKYFNYYRDDRLIQVGGDKDGYLDFYQVHCYPDASENETSPFHNPYSHWKLDKPLLIGEFPNIGCSYGNLEPKKNTSESILYALENGYAGCLTWRWPLENNMGLFSEHVRPALRTIGDYIDTFKTVDQ